MTSKTPRPDRRRKWLIAAGSMVLVLVIGWFVLTSGPVVKALVLPRVAAALHAELAVGELQLSPFSGIDLKDVKLTPTGGRPLVEIAGVKVRYPLFQLLGGAIAIDELELDQPQLFVRQRADGGSDLADWLAKLSGGSGKPAAGGPAGASAPLRLQIGKVTLRQGTARWEFDRADGARDRVTIEALELSVDQLRNGGATVLKLTAAPRVEFRDATGALVDSLHAALDLSARVTLDGDLMPGDLDSRLRLALGAATGRFARSQGLAAQLDARGSLAKPDELTLRFQRGAEEVGRLQVTGGYDAAQGRGTFELGVFKLPPVVLELAAARSGLDFELADFSSTNRIAITQGGQAINAAGGLQLTGFTAKNAAGTTPVLEVALTYDIEVETAARRASIRGLVLTVRQNGQPLADVHVPTPFRFSWSGQPSSEAGSALALRVAQLRLRDWRPFTGELPVDGVLAAQLDLEARELGQYLAFRAVASLAEGEFVQGTNRVASLHAALTTAGELDALRDLRLNRLTARLERAGQPLVVLDGAGRVGLSNLTASVTTTVKGELAPLTGLVAGLPLSVSAGSLTLTSTVNHAASATMVQGNLAVIDLATEVQGAILQQVAVTLPFEVARRGSALRWTLADAGVTEQGAVALRLSSSGQLNLVDRSGTIDFAVPLLTERLINPFLARHTPGQSLRSAQASMVVHGELAPRGRQTWTLSSQSTNVVLVDSNNIPLTPVLGTRAALEVTVAPDENRLWLHRWDGQAFAAGQPAGELRATGEYQFDGRRARLNARVSGVNEHALAPLAPLVLADARLARAELSAEADIDFEATQPSRVRVAAGLRNLEFTGGSGRLIESPRELELRLRAQVASNRLELAEGHVQSTPTPGWSNRVDLAGWLDFAQPGAVRGDFSVRSPGFDLSPFHALVERRRGTTNPVPDIDAVKSGVRAAGAAETALALPVDRLDLALDIRQLKLRQLIVTNWLARATVRSNAVVLDLLSLRLGEAPVNARLQATNIAGTTRFELAAELEGVPVAPFVQTFMPDWQGPAEAELYAAVRLRGEARAGQSLWPSAAGEIHVGLTNANFQPLDHRWQNTLRPVGLLLQTPELFSSPVSWAHQRVTLTNRTLTIDRFAVISDAYVLGLETGLPLADDFTSSPIPRTPVDLYLSRNLVTQLGFLTGADANQVAHYVQLPNFMHLGGTIGAPTIETDKLKLTGMTIGKAGDFVGGSAGDALKRAGGVTEALGGILSGRKITGTEKVDANVVSKGIEGVFDAVGGILGGTGRAVELGTGAVTGTRVADDALTGRLAAFDWPREFTNAPNAASQP